MFSYVKSKSDVKLQLFEQQKNIAWTEIWTSMNFGKVLFWHVSCLTLNRNEKYNKYKYTWIVNIIFFEYPWANVHSGNVLMSKHIHCFIPQCFVFFSWDACCLVPLSTMSACFLSTGRAEAKQTNNPLLQHFLCKALLL